MTDPDDKPEPPLVVRRHPDGRIEDVTNEMVRKRPTDFVTINGIRYVPDQGHAIRVERWQPDPPECEWFWAVERYRAEDDPPVACVRRVAGDPGEPDGFTATDGNATHGSWFFDEDHLRLHFGPFLPFDPPEVPR